MIGFKERRHTRQRLIVHENGTEQRLLGFKIVRWSAERKRINPVRVPIAARR